MKTITQRFSYSWKGRNMTVDKDKAMAEVSTEFFKTWSMNSVDDLRNVSEGLLSKTLEVFDEHNVICDKDKKWRNPDSLSVAQVADCIYNAFQIRNISFEDDKFTLGIYCDENLVEYLDGQFSECKGIYISQAKAEIVIGKLVAKLKYNYLQRDVSEVIENLKTRAVHVKPCYEKDLIAVGNGIFNYESKTLQEFDFEKIFLSKSKVNYNSAAQNNVIHNPEDNTDWDVEAWMKSLSDDPEVVNLLWEIIGAIIRPNVRWNKTAFLVSKKGNNGKGTLCELMRQLCGDGTYASIPIADFGNGFLLEPLARVSAIIVDENDVGTFTEKAGAFKSVVTNDVLTINPKNKSPFPIRFRGFMVQCLNDYPKVKDRSESFFRRLLFIPMTKCFTGAERKYIKDDYLHREDVLEYVLKRVLEMNYYSLSEPDCCKAALNNYKEEIDPVRQFWNGVREELAWNLYPFTFLYDMYKGWFKENLPSGTLIGSRTFISELRSIIEEGDDMWIEATSSVRSKDNMTGPEPLIMKYHMTEWKSASYKGSNPDRICIPDVLQENYRGIVRIGVIANK